MTGLTNNILRISLSLVVWFIVFPSTGQDPLLSDTVQIQEVIITRRQISSIQPGFRIDIVDSAALRNYSLYSIGDLLNETTPLFMKFYGPGGTSTPSFRGTSAGHTLITWNGININNPMPGQSDFSLLPAGMIDNVKISFGGASMDLGEGAIGAIINLENEPLWNSNTLIELNPGLESFGRYSGLLKVKTGTDHFQTITKAYMNSTRNDFLFLDTVSDNLPVLVKRENSEMLQKGFMQELYLRKSNNVLSARVWYHSASRNLPGPLPSDSIDEKQKDESIRTLLNYDIVRKKSEFFITTAWMFTKLDYDYRSKLYPDSSRNRINTLVLKGGMTTGFREYTRLKMVLCNELSSVKTNYYESMVKRNIITMTLSAERRKGDRFAAVILLRETIDGTNLLLPDLSAGLEFRVIKGEDHYLKWNISRNSKIPSMNDCYWKPGGNPDLRNEYSYSSEIGYNLTQKITPKLTAGFDLNIFTNYIRDMIQWRPISETSYVYIADNIRSVNSSGLESSLLTKYRSNNIMIDLKAAYSYTKATAIKPGSPETTGKQLIYIPENQANGLLQIGYKNLYSAWITDFTGIIYTSAYNSEHLSGHTVNNIVTGFRINLKESLIDLRFRVGNLFNVSYQTIAYYPQPGRSYFFTLLFRIIK
ncbi:MAG: TonB-dependent receptor [Bacteroidales bacterium]|jgi:iron complex outermembrane receptor protein|nr:TonB-dependent receptor [Bacteroidales bacterium]